MEDEHKPFKTESDNDEITVTDQPKFQIRDF